MLVSCGCHFVVSSDVPLNSSSKVHCQPPEGAATGGAAPEHSAAGLGPAAVLVVVFGLPPVPRAALLGPACVAVLLVVVLDGVAPASEPRPARPDAVEVCAWVTEVPAEWLPAAFFDCDAVVGVCDLTSWDSERRPVRRLHG